MGGGGQTRWKKQQNRTKFNSKTTQHTNQNKVRLYQHATPTCSAACVAIGGPSPNGDHAEQRRLEPGGVVYHSPARKGFQLEEAGPERGQPGVKVSPHPAGALVVSQASFHLPWVWGAGWVRNAVRTASSRSRRMVVLLTVPLTVSDSPVNSFRCCCCCWDGIF